MSHLEVFSNKSNAVGLLVTTIKTHQNGTEVVKCSRESVTIDHLGDILNGILRWQRIDRQAMIWGKKSFIGAYANVKGTKA